MRRLALLVVVSLGGCSAIVDAPGAEYRSGDADAADASGSRADGGDVDYDGGTDGSDGLDAGLDAATDGGQPDAAVDSAVVDTPDSGADVIVTVDAGPPEPTVLSRVILPVSGFANPSSTNFKARITVGGPVARGVATGPNHSLVLGPRVGLD